MKKIIQFYVLPVVLLLALFSLTGCLDMPPSPAITSGEFEFSVTYEYGGAIKTISGVYVCEYEGLDWVLDGGFHRVWSGYIKGQTTEELITLGTGEDGGIVELDLIFGPDCFMGDSYWEGDEPFSPGVSVRIIDEGLSFETDETLIYEVYGARIVSYEYDPPIKNTFGE